ncbi:MAG: branched-chain amino acid transaminase [Candidatus Altimarinota bacterium]
MKIFLPQAFFEGNFVPFSQANISVATHALHYGTAAFGGMRAFINPENEKEVMLFRLDKHAQRLSKSAKFFGYDISPEYIAEKIIEFIKKNKPQTSIYIRPLVYTSDLDIAPRLHNVAFDFLIYGLEMGEYLSSTDGITCTISSYQRQSDVSFPLRGKISGAYITSGLAKTEAHERGFDEAILLNNQSKVSEGSAMNIFIVRNGKIITPGVNQDILEGITRDSVIQLAKSLGYEVEERQVDKSELFIADEVFFTGTAAKLSAVKKIEQYNLPTTRPIFDTLKSNFELLQLGKIKEFESFVTKIEIE